MSVAQARALVSSAAVLLFVFACATVPITPRPEWAQKPPADTEEQLYFVSSGPSRRAAAEQLADSVVGRLSLGSEADLDAEPVRRFRRRLAAAALGEPGERPEGFRVADRAAAQRDGEVSAWLLATYEREAFAARERALAREVPGGNPGPFLLEQARAHEQDRKLVSALRSYARALLETADTPYAAETMEEVRPRVTAILGRLTLRVERDGVQTRVGRPFEEDLAVSVLDNREDAPVAGMPLLLRYPERLGDGPVETGQLFLRTTEEGRLAFSPPVPEVRGSGTVTVALAPFFDLTLPAQEPGGLRELTELARARSVSLDYAAFSLAAEIPTGVYIVDTDIAGNPTGSMATQRGLLGAFDRRGFTASALPLAADRFLELPQADRASIVRRRFDGEYERAVFGTASITSFEESESVAVEVGGELTAIELDTGEEVYSRRLIQRSRGNTASSAIAAAFRQLGAKFASDLARRLP